MNDILQAVMVRTVTGHHPLVDLETGPQPDAFLMEIDGLRDNIAEIEQNQLRLKNLHETGKTLINSKEIQRNRNEMQHTVDTVNKLGHKVKGRLEALEKENEHLRQSQASGFEDQRRRETLIAALRTKLKDQMAAFSALRSVIQEDYRQVVERRVYTVTGNRVSQEEIDKMIDSGESENIFKQAILQQGRTAVMATITEIEERHKAAKDLEQGLLELNEIFLEMAVLVEEQGHKLDNIEANVERATTFVHSGVQELVVAKRHWRRSNQCKWMLAVLLLIIIAIAVLFILKPWQTKK